ncbi:MAG TPA: hypothetical protein VJ893_09885 [Roseovarius sp.]|nr:hypothetical protein [Roseovarius sp.]
MAVLEFELPGAVRLNNSARAKRKKSISAYATFPPHSRIFPFGTDDFAISGRYMSFRVAG